MKTHVSSAGHTKSCKMGKKHKQQKLVEESRCIHTIYGYHGYMISVSICVYFRNYFYLFLRRPFCFSGLLAGRLRSLLGCAPWGQLLL